MNCFARWREAEHGLYFRDQTMLQYGESWELLSNVILLNPGSAVPVDDMPQDEHLESKRLPYFVKNPGLRYLRFSIDPLMRNLVRLHQARHPGGVIKIYNLFNLKNQHSGKAIEEYKQHRQREGMHDRPEDIRYGDAPVIVATGGNVHADFGLEDALRQFIGLAKPDALYSLDRIENGRYGIRKASPDESGLVESYHPSYTFKYGNTTELAELA